MRASFQHHGQSGQQHGAVHGVRSSALSVRPVLRHPLQCHLPGRGERLGGRQAAELHPAAGSAEERRGYYHSHIDHGSLLRHLRGGTFGQHPRHVRGGQVNTVVIVVVVLLLHSFY